MKESKTSKEIESFKNKEAVDLGIQDFFTKRDKSKRGTKGLVDDSSKIIEEEGEIKQKLYDKSLETDSIPDHVLPLFSGVFVTARRNKLVDNGIFLPTSSFGRNSDTDMDQDFSDTQIVLACGEHANQLKPGYEVVLNMDNFKKRLESNLAQKIGKEYEYILPIEIIEGKEYMYISERDVKYISNTNIIKTK